MQTTEDIMKEFDKEHYDEGQFECDVHERIKSFIKQKLTQARQETFEEERKFMANILDGIDIADKEMGNKRSWTKAIRLALMSRIFDPKQ